MSEVEIIDSKSEKHIEHLMKKRNFYSDFKESPWNWIVIIATLIIIILILYVEIIFLPRNDPFYYRYGKKPKIWLPIYLVNFIVLILIQGEWQVYRTDSNTLETFTLVWFSILMLMVFLIEGWAIGIVLGILLILQIKYLLTRESKIASRISLLEEKVNANYRG